MDDHDTGDASSLPLEQENIPNQPNWVEPPGPLDTLHPDLSDGSMMLVTYWEDQTTTPESLNIFLTRWPPSRTPIDHCGWIYIDRGGYNSHPRASLDRVKSSFQSLIASGNVTVPEIDRIALENGVLSGTLGARQDN
jgi:hypothetical protein